jgi:hypothetical protein
VDINGEDFENSLHYHCELYCDGPSPQIYTAVLGRKYRALTAIAGVVDTATRGTSAKFEIDVGVPPTFRTVDLIGSRLEWRMGNAGAA